MIPAYDEQTLPAPLHLRMVAFAMDCLFVIFASLASAQAFFPNEIETGMETWKTYVERFRDLEEGAQKDAEGKGTSPPPETTKLDQNEPLNESRNSMETNASVVSKTQSKEEAYRELENILKTDTNLLEMVRVIIFSLFWVGFIYWFAGERFFGGSSLGKRMFSLATLNLRDGMPPGTVISFLRVFLKVAPVLLPLLVFSYLIAVFNRRRMAGHDYACRTMVIRGQFSSREREESTNATP